jgi:hypothetical protein
MFCDGGGVILYYQNLALLAIWGIEIRAGKDIWGDMGEYKNKGRKEIICIPLYYN